MSIFDRTYRWSLRALPADIRDDFADDMLQLFRDERRRRRGRPLALARYWLAAVVDALVCAVDERAARRVPRAPVSWRSLMRAVMSDARHGFRLLRRYPSSSILAVATLAIGIGANTAIFSVVDAVLLRQLPYSDPDRIVMVWEKRPREGAPQNVVSPADYLDWRARNTVFQQMAAYSETSTSIVGDGDPVVVPAAGVGYQFFDLLGVRPEVGRSFTADDETFGRHRVAMLSHRIWLQRYGSDRSIVGRKIVLNGNPWEVIGVLPADFQFIEASIDVWSPLVLEGTGQPPSRTSHQLTVYARLKPDVSFAQALDSMDRLGQQLELEHPDESRGHGANVTSMRDVYTKDFKTSLTVIFAAVGLVLLIGCVNVANLLMARAVSRRREMAVRSALGATRVRLLTQSLVESVALATVGGALGVGVAVLVMRVLPLVLPAQMSVVELTNVTLDLRVLLFAVTCALLTGLLFGVLPALRASKPVVADVIKEGGRGPGGVRRRSRIALIVSEVALASLTLVGAGLVLRSFAAISAQPLGVNPRDVFTFAVSMPVARYPDPDARVRALAELEQRMAALPGVTSVGAINLLPLSGGDSRQGVVIENREVKPDDPPTRMHPRFATPGYFATMGIQIVRGRAFTPQDDQSAQRVAVINQTAARRFWPNEDPIGKHVRFTAEEQWRTVVGIAADVRHWGLSRPVNPMWYLPQAQMRGSFLTFVLKSRLDPSALAKAVRAQVAAFDDKLPISGAKTMDALVSESVRAQRAQTVLIASFGVLALLLAVIGIYGVMAQLVVVRVHEIGVRMTLGARPRDVLRQLLLEGLWQTLAGLALGLLAGAYLMKLGQDLLFETKPRDPTTLAGVSIVLVIAAMAACLIPARRAMRVDPVVALRET